MTIELDLSNIPMHGVLPMARTRLLSFSVLALLLLAAGVITPQETQAQTLSEQDLAVFNYRSIGPTSQSGRFVDFAVPLQQPGTFYAASASGHLWKTENYGLTFQALFDNEAVYSIGDIAVQE